METTRRDDDGDGVDGDGGKTRRVVPRGGSSPSTSLTVEPQGRPWVAGDAHHMDPHLVGTPQPHPGDALADGERHPPHP